MYIPIKPYLFTTLTKTLTTFFLLENKFSPEIYIYMNFCDQYN